MGLSTLSRDANRAGSAAEQQIRERLARVLGTPCAVEDRETDQHSRRPASE
jgi:hypothetical protein